MGQMAQGLGNVFNAGSDQVAGTGQSVNDLKKTGYSPQDIQTLGGGQPSGGVDFARHALQGGLSGLSQGLGQQRPQPRPGGGGGIVQSNQTPAITPQIFNPQGPTANPPMGGPSPLGGMQGGGKKRAMDSLNFYGGQ